MLKLQHDIVPSFISTAPHLVNMYRRTVSYNDLDVVTQLVQTEEEKKRIRQIANQLSKETMRGSVSAYWQFPLIDIFNGRAYLGAILIPPSILFYP